MKILQKYFLLAVLAGAVLAGCRNDDDQAECPTPCDDPSNPECPNYDPCHDMEQPSARFYTEDRLIWPEFGEYLWIHDSILRGGPVQFRSSFEDPMVSHTWYIGSQIFDTPSVVRNFSAVPRPTLITVSHVITYQVDSLCYPEATGIDSVSQSFYLIDYYKELLTIDKFFRGVLNNQTDSFDFKIRALQRFTGIEGRFGMSGVDMYAINFHNNQDSIMLPFGGPTNTHFAIYEPNLQGALLEIDPKDLSVEMNYRFNGNQTQYTFKGRLIAE